MTDPNIQKGPGQGEAPAPSSLAGDTPVLTYTLTAQDLAAALAHEKSEKRAGRALVASSLLAGLMGLQFLSGRLPLPPSPLAAWIEAAVILGLPVALAFWTRQQRLLRHARERMPVPVTARLTIHPDRLEETRSDRDRPVVLRPRLLTHLHLGRTHLLAATETAQLILPRAAFADRAAMVALAEQLQAARK